MPLFMDRHDLPEVTASQVAQAHLADLDAEARFGVHFLAYWFDAAHGEAFCLADAPKAESLAAVHRSTHGLIPNEIISVSENDVLRFLGRMNESGTETQPANPFRTILFTDLEGSTTILDSVGQAAYMVLLTEHDLIIRRALVTWRGREVKHTGDGIMASFDDVANSLECALAIEGGFGHGPRRPPRRSCGCGSASPPVSRSITTMISSARPSPSRAGSARPPRPVTSSRRTSCTTWASSMGSRSMTVVR